MKMILVCVVVFFHTVNWAVTDMLYSIAIINTLCSGKTGFRTSCDSYTCMLSRKVLAEYLYAKASGSRKMIRRVIAFRVLTFQPLLLQSIVPVVLLSNSFLIIIELAMRLLKK